MAKGISLVSASFEADGDQARDEHLRDVIESAGYEVPEAQPLPPLPALDQTGAPTPAEQQKNIEDYGKQVARAKDKYADWDEKVNRDIYIGQAAQLACLECENGAEVIYHLGCNPQMAERLGKMSPIRQAAEIGRLSSQLPKPQRVERPPKTDNATSSEIATMRDFPGKYRELKRAWRERR